MLSFLAKLCRVFDSETRQADLWLPPVHLRCSETADLHARVAGPRARAGRTQAGFQGAGSASSLTTEASRSSPLAAPLHPSSVESPGCVDSVSLRSPLPLAKAPAWSLATRSMHTTRVRSGQCGAPTRKQVAGLRGTLASLPCVPSLQRCLVHHQW